MMLKKILPAAVALCLLAATAVSNTTSFWTQTGVPQFYKGKFDGAALTDTGRIVLGTKVEQVFETTEPYLWSAAYDNKGFLWAGSGNKAILYRLGRGKDEIEEAAILPGAGISAIAVDGGGGVYAAVFPGGSIHFVRPGKRAELFAQLPAAYVWDMKFSRGGSLYCVTGSPAGAFKINSEGKVTPLYMSGSERHFLSMFLEGDKYLYTGTSPSGLILRVNIEVAEKQSFSARATVRFTGKEPAIAPPPAPDEVGMEAETETDEYIPEIDDVFKAEVAPTSDLAQKDEEKEPEPDPRVNVLIDLEEDEAFRLLPWKDGWFLVAANRDQTPQQPPQAPGRPQRPEPISFQLPPKNPAQQQQAIPARVYLVNQNGQTRQALEIPDPYILSMSPLDEGRVLIGTGNEGRIYALDVDNDSALLQELPVSQVLAIVGEGESLRLVTGNPGAVFAPAPAKYERGEFVSSINDASTPAVYGNLDAVALVPVKASLEFRTRTGNTPDPVDGTWSAWSQPEGNWPFRITSPPGRFIQFKASLQPAPEGASPELREVKIFYITANQPPEIGSVSVTPSPQPRRPTAPPAKTNNAAPGGPAAAPPGAPPGRPGQQMGPLETNLIVGSIAASGDITFRWQVTDPDQDDLRFSLHFRQLPGDIWVELEDKFYENEYRWNTESVPDGKYEIRITASDVESNPADRALSDEEISDPFIIDHSRPLVLISDIRRIDGNILVTGVVTDGASVVSAIEYSVDDLEWRIVFPVDGLFDSGNEAFSFLIDAPGPGTHNLIIRARDFVGNVGSASRPF